MLAVCITWQRLVRVGLVVTLISLSLIYFSQHFNGAYSIARPGPNKTSHNSLNQDTVQSAPSTTIDSQSQQYLAVPTPSASPEQSASKSPSPIHLPGSIPGIPAKIWQSAKNNEFTDEQRTRISSWWEKNPSFRYELLTDKSADSYVISRYNESRPDIVALYTALPIVILKADLLRYLILLSDGGIWSDLDVTCEKEVGGWLPVEWYSEDRPVNISLILGLEFDIQWQRERSGVWSQFTNWVFAAAPGSSHLQLVVDEVVKGLYDIARENNVGPDGITLDMISDVVDVTGPKKMTLGVVQSLGKMLERKVDDRDIAGVKKEPRVLGDVIIMPGMAFAGLQNGFPEDQGDALVSHHYSGSWKGPADAARENRKKKLEKEKAEKMKAEKMKQEQQER